MANGFPSKSHAEGSPAGQADVAATVLSPLKRAIAAGGAGITQGSLTYVAEASPDCQIFRDLARGYLVCHRDLPGGLKRVATLACAYSLCHDIEHPSELNSAFG
ncbi:hypothetical protein [Cyanobium sp. NS01]|uniref:hypothetical protein n=1 Tax=Cyanobium sp. NS01 TaxID=261284 RepID=UPI001644DC71|nr:hypothetical protein [Cyanobium sp. NS01]QNI70170.1 hypothetical protein CyaNS01_01033 [Cyanobium sp. NS01]